MSERPLISIIIVNWNVRDLLQANLARLFALQHAPLFEVIVVDNGSSDASVAMIKTAFKEVHLIRNETNRGFAFACNQGLRMAHGEMLLLLNPDMEVREGVLEHMVETLTQEKDVGVMGVKLLHEDGTVVASVRRDPGFIDQLAILLKLPHLFPTIIDQYLAKDFDYAVSQNVDQLRGSFFAFRRDVLEKVGPFDAENFFIWFEEVDFCKRVKAAGYRLWYSAQVVSTDLIGRSFRQRTVLWKQTQLGRSMAHYFKKWHPWWQAAIIYALRPFAMFSGWLVDVVKAKHESPTVS